MYGAQRDIYKTKYISFLTYSFLIDTIYKYEMIYTKEEIYYVLYIYDYI